MLLAGLLVAFGMQSSGANLLQRGLLDLRGGRYENARTELEEASRVQPDNAFIWVSLAEACRRTKHLEEADKAAVKAEQLGGAEPAVLHALAIFYAGEGKYAPAARLEERYAGSPRADAQALSRAGGFYLQAGDVSNGERVFRENWERAKSDPDAAFSYTQIKLRKLDFGGASDVVSPALAAHPDNVQLVLSMGVVRYGQRRFEEAMDEFLKVITLDPSVPQPYEFLGRMLEQAGDRLKAIRAATERWAASNPDNAEAQLVLAKVQLSQDAKDAAAEGLLRRAIALDDKSWEAHYELGAVLEARRDFRGAAAELQRASELRPDEPMPHYHLARVYDRLGEADKAKAERARHDELIAAGR